MANLSLLSLHKGKYLHSGVYLHREKVGISEEEESQPRTFCAILPEFLTQERERNTPKSSGFASQL